MNTLLGEELIKLVDGKEQKVPVNTIEGEGKVVALYFSAHWCPPCRAFTPMLATWYKKVKAGPNGSNFEIVFASSDRDKESFIDYFKSMPWLALPYEDRDRKSELSKKFKVSGIPALVILNGVKGRVITADGRSIVLEDTEGKDFPWTPKPFFELVKGKFYLDVKGKETTEEYFKGKIIGLYFSAHWCGPCRGFTPKLKTLYKKLRDEGKQFEIIYVSSDREEEQFKKYFAEMPWTSLPYDKEDKRRSTLARVYDVQGIPSLVLVDENGMTITTTGRAAVNTDEEGLKFPWYPEPVNLLEQNRAGDINDLPSLIWFNDKKEGKELLPVMEPVGKKWIQKWKDEDEEQGMVFFVAGSDAEDEENLVESLKSFAKIKSTTQLAIVDIGAQKVYQSEAVDITTDVIDQVVKDFFDNKLEGKPLTLQPCPDTEVTERSL